MWTTSSSRGRWPWVPALGVACLGGAVVACAPDQGSDTPRLVDTVAEVVQAPGVGGSQEPLVLEGVAARRLAVGDSLLPLFLTPEELERADGPILLEVTLRAALDPRPRSSLPVIVLNGQALGGTRMDRETLRHLRVVLPSAQLLQERNVIEALWLGAEVETRSPEPLILGIGDLGA